MSLRYHRLHRRRNQLLASQNQLLEQSLDPTIQTRQQPYQQNPQLRQQLQLSDDYQEQMREFFRKERIHHAKWVDLLYTKDPNGMQKMMHLRSHYNESAWALFLKNAPPPLLPGHGLKDMKEVRGNLHRSCQRVVKLHKENEGIEDEPQSPPPPPPPPKTDWGLA